MSLSLKELYVQNETTAIGSITKKIMDRLQEEGKIHHIQKNGKIKEDSFLELDKIVEDEAIYFKKKNNKPKEWIVPIKTLEDAIKFTIRKGKVARATEYLKMNGSSNFIGTPLHLLINSVNNDEYLKNSIVGKKIPHKVFGDVKVDTVDYNTEVVTATINEKEKALVMEYWQVENGLGEIFENPTEE